MGYNIYLSEQGGLVVPADRVPEFADSLAKAVVKEMRGRLPSGDFQVAEAKKACDEILAAGGTSRKVVLLHGFLEDKAKYPFSVSGLGDGSLEVSYDPACWGERWDESRVEAVLGTLARYVRRNAYLGFIGEDMNIWSYVFDGMGGYREVYPRIDWTGTRIPDDEKEEDL
jgi:hypothetical protein